MLILFALIIVTGSKLFASNKAEEMPPSYGAQISAYAGAEKQTEGRRQNEVEAGTKIDEYKGVAVYSNGSNYMADHGLSYSDDGYYYGYKWQCVEFVKRFYYEKFGHEMPDGAGHAKYFYNPMLEQGQLNEQRGLFQYDNGGNKPPQKDDLLVFTDGAYGHVAIISEVRDGWIEVIQQNSEVSRDRYTLKTIDGNYFLAGEREPAGWLRR
jgi:surface antigen